MTLPADDLPHSGRALPQFRPIRTISPRTADSLLKSMLILARTIENVLEERACDVAGEPLSRSEVQVLRLLKQRGPQTATKIAVYLGVSRPAVTQIIDNMVADRLVRRSRSETDGRGVELSLTGRGNRVAGVSHKEQRHLVRSTVRQCSPEKIEQWTQTLEEMAGALGRAGRAFTKFCLQCGAHGDGSCVLVGGGASCPYLGPGGPRAAKPRRSGRTKSSTGRARPVRPSA